MGESARKHSKRFICSRPNYDGAGYYGSSTRHKKDKAPEGRKRVELHTHTKLSQMDAVSSAAALVAQAAKWGHPAIAITDHANVQAFPEAYNAGKKHGVKVLFGLEANLVDDGVPIVYDEQHRLLEDDTFVVFDVETTGLSAVYDTVIELAAVRVKMVKSSIRSNGSRILIILYLPQRQS